MPLKKIAQSHVDHVNPAIVDWALARHTDKNGFFIDTTELPEHLGTLENGLYGPACGDPAVTDSEVTHEKRGQREHTSRMIDKPKRQTRTVTIIGGPYNDEPCVLYTVFGGPVTPKEPNDPFLKEEEKAKSVEFWKDHALAK